MAVRGGAKHGVVALLLALSFLAISVSILAVQSTPNAWLEVTPDAIALNWTNNYRANLMIANNYTANISAIILNTTTYISGNYSQRLPFDNDTYGPQYNKYWWTQNPGCFHANATLDNPLVSYNGSSATGANVTSNNTAFLQYTNWSIFSLVSEVLCPPGRYFGRVGVQNSTGEENLNITVYMDVPISSDNELSESTGIGYFKGRMEASYPEYHYYYFNASNITNSTAISIDLSWSGQANDLDIFLFDDSGNLKAKSIDNYTNSESLFYSYLTPDMMYEIRV